MTVQSIAIILLIIRLVSFGLVVAILYRQVLLLKLSSSGKIAGLRARMLALGVVFLLGHILPVMTDVYYGFLHESNNTRFSIVVYYAISNAISGLAASMLLWKIYDESGKHTEKQQGKSINIDEIPKK